MNNAWNFNGNNGNLNNNNVNNANQVGAVTILPKTVFTLMTDERFFSIMVQTMFNARKNKRYGRDSADFERNWAPRLVRMTHQLQERTFRVDHNYAFLTSIPKWREIFATIFEGRTADHLLCDTLEKYAATWLSPRTFNNREGMGMQAAINQVLEDIYEVTQGFTQPCRIIKWDLSGFFPNAQNDYIERCYRNLIEHNREAIAAEYDDEMPNFLQWLAMICVHSNPAQHCELRTPKRLWGEHIKPDKSLIGKPPGIGCPIGRQASQIGMGLYLNDEIVWLNKDRGIRSTLFMDDCVEVVPEWQHQYALSLFPELRRRLAAKGIRLNEHKFYDQPYYRGFEFLGSHIKLNRVHLNNKTYGRARMRIGELNALPSKLAYIDHFVQTMNSYIGLLKNRTDYKRMLALVDMADAGWWTMCEWNDEKKCVAYRPGYKPNERLVTKYHLKLKRNDKSRNSRAQKH